MNEHPVMTPERMAAWWGREPLHSAVSPQRETSAALWDFRSAQPVEIFGEPDGTTHILSIHTRSFRHDSFMDGARVYPRPVGPGTVCLVDLGVRPRSVLYDGFSCLQLYVPHRTVVDLAGAMTGCDEVELRDPCIAFDPQVWNLAHAMIAAMERDDLSTRLQFQGLMQAMVALVIANWSSAASTAMRTLERKANQLAPWQLRRTEALVRANLARNLTLQELATEARLSPFHFARCFQATTGESPHRYLIRLRLEHARSLLEQTDLSVTDISARIGFDDPAYLARLFRRELGVTPTKYRQERRS